MDVELKEIEEGSFCLCAGCGGVYEFTRDRPCSCHINPPCGACTEASLACSVCGEKAEDAQFIPMCNRCVYRGVPALGLHCAVHPLGPSLENFCPDFQEVN
jgi:hypothetical protein